MSLYPAEGAHWWSRSDHLTVVDVMRRVGARHVLEFGPGTSTLSLIEGGAEYVDCCEDDPHWFAVYCRRLEDRFPAIVRMRPYTWQPDLRISGVDDQRYDLALIDGPARTYLRPAVIAYAAARCDRLLVPLENHGATEDNGLRAAVEACGRAIHYIESGPLAGSFALVGRR